MLVSFDTWACVPAVYLGVKGFFRLAASRALLRLSPYRDVRLAP